MATGSSSRPRTGVHSAFRVVETRVVRADASGLDPTEGGPTGARLALVTCYPFDGVLRSPLRYVVLPIARSQPRRADGYSIVASRRSTAWISLSEIGSAATI